MQTFDDRSWHGRIYVLSYTMFNAIPQIAPDRGTYWCTVVGTTVYCLVAGAIFLTLNVATLPFGILTKPVWQPKARFLLLHFPGGIPIPPIAGAIWLAYVTYHIWTARGPLFAVGPWLFVAGLGFFFLGVAMLYNRLRGV